MKKHLILLVIVLACYTAQAQNTVAKLKFEDAEKAFYDGDYQSCVGLLDETEKLLGQSAPNILHLRIMAESKIWEADPYGSYEQLEKLRNLCGQYLKNYDIAGLEGKYREVYDLKDKLPKVNSVEELKLLGQQIQSEEKAEKLNKIIAANNLVFVEGGIYMMGEDKHAHEVTVGDFYIGRYEITVKEWNNYLISQGRDGHDWAEDKPMQYLRWEEAMAYCKWLEEQYGGTWRLPTEAEWEYAARGGNKSQGYKYSGSNNWKEVTRKAKFSQFFPIGSFKPNELGIYDMTGNVFEWCYDWYDKNYYATSPKENPMGPETGKNKVLRGGGGTWVNWSVYSRHYGCPSFQDCGIGGDSGFRVIYIPD